MGRYSLEVSRVILKIFFQSKESYTKTVRSLEKRFSEKNVLQNSICGSIREVISCNPNAFG